MKETINTQELLDAFDDYCRHRCPYVSENWCPECQFDELKGIILKMADPDKKTKPSFKVGDIVLIKKAFKPELKGQIGIVAEVRFYGGLTASRVYYMVYVRKEEDSKNLYGEEDLRYATNAEIIADTISYFRSRLTQLE